MGRTITPKYAVEVEHGSMAIQSTPSAWRGVPTPGRLRQWVAAYNESLKPGGVNQHLTTQWPIESCRIIKARIIRNDGSRELIASVGVITGAPAKSYADELTEKIERDGAIRKAANNKFSVYLNALEEHKSEAEREGNKEMADLYASVLDGLYSSKGIDKSGRLTITIDLARELR
jgi:hypothetical protein